MKKITVLSFTLLLVISFSLHGQEKEASPFDFGKMWTFENPPKDWFKEAYDFDVTDEWLEDVRLSSLRFATWCSASFVSPNGLIMTNHHCSRDVANKVQGASENFDKNGYYAVSQNDERRVDDLFVEQMVKTEDITDAVMKLMTMKKGDASMSSKEALDQIKSEYSNNPEWAGLRLQAVSFYSGGRFSLYGYKKYTDIRLVFIPELDLGFYGGDPDNFTYPRYNLDCTFWRAYDEEGNPLNTSANYLEFNIEGIQENEPVFVVGNPGSTERYRTVAQLNYDRDFRYNMNLRFLRNRHALMQESYDEMKDDPTRDKEAQALLGDMFNLSNSIKAISGVEKGLKNEELMGRKIEMEKIIRAQSSGVSYWDDLEKEYEKLSPHAWAINHLGPSRLRGWILLLLHDINAYKDLIETDVPATELSAAKDDLVAKAQNLNNPDEVNMFILLLEEIQADIPSDNNTLTSLLNGKSINQYVTDLVSETKFNKIEDSKKFLSKDKNIKKAEDPLVKAAVVLIPQYVEAVKLYRGSSEPRKQLESKIANQTFQVFGTSLPPDATFTLRISDGLVKGYDYNGTEAPFMTTYFGLYDRHYSNKQESPWALPEKWANPPMELLKTPLNLVSTNDIIGGNSGSPLINKNGEAVGLIFDGNIESLPGKFIFDDEKNRTVSVHAGGIYSALKYIFKADRITDELVPPTPKRIIKD
jgi:hypothetical protein